MYKSSLITPAACPIDLEWIVLRRDFADEVGANDGDFDENVVSHFGNLVEEEDGEDTGGDTEAGGDGAIADRFRSAHAPKVRHMLRPGGLLELRVMEGGPRPHVGRHGVDHDECSCRTRLTWDHMGTCRSGRWVEVQSCATTPTGRCPT